MHGKKIRLGPRWQAHDNCYDLCSQKRQSVDEAQIWSYCIDELPSRCLFALFSPITDTRLWHRTLYCHLLSFVYFLSELPEHAITLRMLRQTLNVRTNNHACSSFLDNHNEPGKNATLGTFTPQAFCNFRHNITWRSSVWRVMYRNMPNALTHVYKTQKRKCSAARHRAVQRFQCERTFNVPVPVLDTKQVILETKTDSGAC